MVLRKLSTNSVNDFLQSNYMKLPCHHLKNINIIDTIQQWAPWY